LWLRPSLVKTPPNRIESTEIRVKQDLVGRGEAGRRFEVSKRAGFQRGISEEEVRGVIRTGEVIEDYPGDLPYPSRLVLGWHGPRPIHVVVADNVNDAENIVVTVYEPDPEGWEADFKRRKT
jgi:hypothetical protein